MPMGWSKGFMDDDGHCNKRRKFTQNPNSSTNMIGRYYTNKVETAKWVDGRIGLHCTLFEGISVVKSELACVKYDMRKLCSMLRCLEPNIETLGKKICEIEQSLSDMKVGVMESIVTDVIKVLKTTSSNTMPQVAEKVLESNEDIVGHKVAENVLESKEDIDGHSPWTDIIKDKQPIQLCPCPPIATDVLLQMKISDKAPHQKVDHMADEKVTESADKNTSTGFNDSKVKNKNDKFPSMRNLSKKDSKILKFLFENGDNGVDDPREEVAHYGDIGVSYAELQCLKPTFPLLRKIIDISAAYLYEEESKSWFLPTCFGEQAYSNHVSSDSHALVASTIHLCGLQRFHRCLKRCTKIFIPLHDEIEDQWFMLVVKLDKKSAEMWDSLPDIVSLTRRFEKARVAMLLLQKIFENEMTKSDDVYYHFPSFRVTIPQNNPTHDNKYDSGIYIIRHMQWYGEKWFEGFNSCDQRTILALEIVNHPKNELLKSVSAATIGLQRPKDSGQGLSTSTKPLTLTTDLTIGCDNLMSNTNDMPPTGRKCRSHRRRRSACDG